MYEDIIDDSYAQFAEIIQHMGENDRLDAGIRRPEDFLQESEEGRILIDGVTYRVAPVFFSIANLALKRAINKCASEHMDDLKTDDGYVEARSNERLKIQRLFVDKFILKMHREYLFNKSKKKAQSDSADKKPEQTNHASKHDYVMSNVESSIIALYMDAYYDLSGEVDTKSL